MGTLQHVAEELKHDQSQYKIYRLQATAYLQDNSSYFEQFYTEEEDYAQQIKSLLNIQDLPFEDYLRIITEDGIWESNLELEARSQMYSIPIFVFVEDFTDPMHIFGEKFYPESSPCLLQFESGNHYTPL